MPEVPRSGIEVARDFHHDVVRPLLLDVWPRLPYAAGRLGYGSEVLGLDDQMSRDHNWGLRLSVFVPDEMVPPVSQVIAQGLPPEYQGLPTRFAFSGELQRHHVEVVSPRTFVLNRIGFDRLAEPGPVEWLSLTGQAVLEIVAGPVFEDHVGELTRLREALDRYPDDVWRYVVVSGWQRIDQELPLMGRGADRGDDLGSRVIAARLTGAVMHLAFTLHRRWRPYAKWGGTLLRRLPESDSLCAHLEATLRADCWRDRQESLAAALQELLSVQAASGLPVSARSATRPFWDRPYLEITPEVVRDVRAGICSDAVRHLPPGVGSIEQITDSVDVLVDVTRRHATVTGALAIGGSEARNDN